MTIRFEQQEKVLEALVAHLLATGLSQSSLRQLAAAAGVSDRMLLYYFADKADVLGQAMSRLAGRMADRLGTAIPEGAGLTQAQLAAQAGRLVLDEDFVPYMRLWLEVVAAAARREEPFATIARQVTHGFLDWIGQRLDAPPGPARDGVAAMTLALVDGLILVEIGAGREHALRALASIEALAKAG